MHRTIRHVTEDIEALRFNTAVARLMAFGNALTPLDVRPRAAVEALVLLLSPFAPHVGEELWGKLGHGPTLAYAPWPVFDAALARDEQRAYVVQVNGKLLGRIRRSRRRGKRHTTSGFSHSDNNVTVFLFAGNGATQPS